MRSEIEDPKYDKTASETSTRITENTIYILYDQSSDCLPKYNLCSIHFLYDHRAELVVGLYWSTLYWKSIIDNATSIRFAY